jgi:GT2 family glycosyltransferase
MKFSLLVVTTDRLSMTERLFGSLTEQTLKDFEVVFLHDERCAAQAAGLVSRFADALVIERRAVPSCGISRARNLGLPLCGGEIIAFPDDDCAYAPDTLTAVADVFRLHPEADGILAVGTDPETPGHGKVSGALPTSGTAGTRRNRHIAGSLPTGGERAARARSVNRYALFGCSETWRQFYRRRCVESVGAFDETLGAGGGSPYGSGEDTDYALRALRAGFRILRAPSVAVRHPAPDMRDPDLDAKVEAYARGRMYLLRKHSLPLWFRLANVMYPPAALIPDVLRAIPPAVAYRRRMFAARLAHF